MLVLNVIAIFSSTCKRFYTPSRYAKSGFKLKEQITLKATQYLITKLHIKSNVSQK